MRPSCFLTIASAFQVLGESCSLFSGLLTGKIKENIIVLSIDYIEKELFL